MSLAENEAKDIIATLLKKGWRVHMYFWKLWFEATFNTAQHDIYVYTWNLAAPMQWTLHVSVQAISWYSYSTSLS